MLLFQKLRDKTLAGKNAIFDVSVLEVSTRKVPEIDDELAAKIRPGLTADGVLAEVSQLCKTNTFDTYHQSTMYLSLICC